MLPQLEDHREGVGNLHGAVPLPSGLPLRGAGDNADSFLVQRRVDTTEDLDVGNGTVGIDGELEGYTALNTVLLGDLGIREVGIHPFGELVGITSLEGRLLLDELERNGLLLYFLLFDGLDVIGDLDTEIGVVLEVEDEVVLKLDIIVDDVDLVGKDGDLGSLRRRRRGLLGDRDNLFLNQFLIDIIKQSSFLFLGGVGESSPHDQKGGNETNLCKEQSFVLKAGLR